VHQVGNQYIVNGCTNIVMLHAQSLSC